MDRDEGPIRSLILGGSRDEAVSLALQEYGREMHAWIDAQRLYDPDEVYADFTESLLRSIASFDLRCSMRTWCYAIARRAVLRSFDRPRFSSVDIHSTRAGDIPVPAPRTPTQPWLRTSIRDAYDGLRAELPEEDRCLLVLRVDRDLAWDEVAVVLAGPEVTLGDEALKRESAALRRRFSRIVTRLRARAAELGLTTTPDTEEPR